MTPAITPEIGTRTALIAVGVLLVAINLASTVWLSEYSLVVALIGTVALVWVARAASVSAAELGLARETWRRGLRWAGLAIVFMASVYAVLIFVPGLSGFLGDERAPDTLAATAVEALLVIPLRTVLLEEFAFRGLLWALLRRRTSSAWATTWTALIFGCWHVVPALGFAGANPETQDALGRSVGATALVVAGTVLFTGLMGVVLCELRRRSGSLLAPMGLHWAANGLGTFATYLR